MDLHQDGARGPVAADIRGVTNALGGAGGNSGPPLG